MSAEVEDCGFVVGAPYASAGLIQLEVTSEEGEAEKDFTVVRAYVQEHVAELHIVRCDWTPAPQPGWLTVEARQPDRLVMRAPAPPDGAPPIEVFCRCQVQWSGRSDTSVYSPKPLTVRLQGGAHRWKNVRLPGSDETKDLTDIQLKRVIRAGVEGIDAPGVGDRARLRNLLDFAKGLRGELLELQADDDTAVVSFVSWVWMGCSGPNEVEDLIDHAEWHYAELVRKIALLKEHLAEDKISQFTAESAKAWSDELKVTVERLEVQGRALCDEMSSVMESMVEGAGRGITALELTKTGAFAALGAVWGAALGGGTLAAGATSFVTKLVEEAAKAGGDAWAGVNVPTTERLLWTALKSALVSTLGDILKLKLLKPLGRYFVRPVISDRFFVSPSRLRKNAVFRDALLSMAGNKLNAAMKKAIDAFDGTTPPRPEAFSDTLMKALATKGLGTALKVFAKEEFDLDAWVETFGAEEPD